LHVRPGVLGVVLGAGALGTLIGVRSALSIAALGGLTGFLSLLPSPLPGFRMLSGNATEPLSVKGRSETSESSELHFARVSFGVRSIIDMAISCTPHAVTPRMQSSQTGIRMMIWPDGYRMTQVRQERA
jgi:hypothetical protein